MNPVIVIAAVVWGGVAWRLRGGAFTTITGINPGTDGARAGGALLIAGALAAATREWRVLVIAPAILAGLKITGWGPFQGDGTENMPGYRPEKSWMRWLPKHLGLRAGHFGEDSVGLIEAGLICMAPGALAVSWLTGWSLGGAMGMFAAGALFPVPYAVALIGFPTIPRFAKGQSWGEIGVGMLVTGAILAALGCAH